MLEIVFVGRGGQGARTAAQFVAEAAIESGSFVQAFSEFGPERTGAPVRSFVRISEKPITVHSLIYSPDVAVVIDPTLIAHFNITEGMEKGSTLIVNCPLSADEARKETGFKGKVFAVDATRISMKLLGANIPNTPMLGALAKVTGVVAIDAIARQVERKFKKRLAGRRQMPI